MKQDYVLSATEEGFHRIAYTEWGSANVSHLSTVICVHGLTRNSRDFDSLAYFLSQKGHHVFCPDVVGRGDSSWLKDANQYNFKRYVKDLTVLIGRTGANEIDWIGTSMGGVIGIIIASLNNTPIKRLVLNDVSPQLPMHALWQMAKYVGKDPHFADKDEAKAYFKHIFNEFGPLTDEQWDRFTEHSIQERVEGGGGYTAKYDPSIHEFKPKWQAVKDLFYNPLKAMEGVFLDIDLWSYWQKITCPVLVIRGKKSQLLLPEHIKKMKRLHHNVDVFEVPEAGHAPALMEEFHQKVIADWLIST